MTTMVGMTRWGDQLWQMISCLTIVRHHNGNVWSQAHSWVWQAAGSPQSPPSLPPAPIINGQSQHRWEHGHIRIKVFAMWVPVLEHAASPDSPSVTAEDLGGPKSGLEDADEPVPVPTALALAEDVDELMRAAEPADTKGKKGLKARGPQKRASKRMVEKVAGNNKKSNKVVKETRIKKHPSKKIVKQTTGNDNDAKAKKVLGKKMVEKASGKKMVGKVAGNDKKEKTGLGPNPPDLTKKKTAKDTKTSKKAPALTKKRAAKDTKAS